MLDDLDVPTHIGNHAGQCAGSSLQEGQGSPKVRRMEAFSSGSMGRNVSVSIPFLIVLILRRGTCRSKHSLRVTSLETETIWCARPSRMSSNIFLRRGPYAGLWTDMIRGRPVISDANAP